MPRFSAKRRLQAARFPAITLTTLKRKFSWPEHRVAEFLGQVRALAEICEPKHKLSVLADEPDHRVLECAVEGKADIIISGDQDLLRLKDFRGIPIRNPRYLTYLFK